MSGSPGLTPPGWGESARTPRAVLASIDAWLDGPALPALVEGFGGRMPDTSTADRLEWLDAFSAEHWDFRAGKERNLAQRTTFDEPMERLVGEVAEALSLTRAMPPAHSSYTHLLILGGLVRACLLRPRHAAKLVADGLQVGTVSALSAYRDLRGDEDELIGQLGLHGISNEMQAMEAGLVAAFGLGQPIDEQVHEQPGAEFATSLVRTWRSSGPPVQLVIAPSPEPTVRRANTADTYRYWADRCVHLGPSDRVLLVTSSIYLPFQHSDAVRMLALPYGCSVETVGIDFSDESLGALRQPFTPANYLQEIRSAVRSVRTLHATARELAAADRVR